MMVLELKVEQVGNGYVIYFLDFTGKKRIFASFADLTEFLFDYFGEKTVKT